MDRMACDDGVRSSARRADDHGSRAAGHSRLMYVPSAVRQRPRTRRPDGIRRACTLLACGWNFQSWGAEGFSSMVPVAGSSSCSAARGWAAHSGSSSSSTSSSSSCPATKTAQRHRERSRSGLSASSSSATSDRRPASNRRSRALAEDEHDRRRSSRGGAGVGGRPPPTVRLSSTLDRQGDGALVDQEEEEDEEDDADERGGKGGKTSRRGPSSSSSSTSEKQQRKPKQANPNSNRILDLLNGLEGGGGGGIEGGELFGISASGIDFVAPSTLNELELGSGDAVVDLGIDDDDDDVGTSVPSSTLSLQDVVDEPELAQEGVEGGLAGEVVDGSKTYARRRVKQRMRGPVPPLTRSQSEEASLLPTANLIRELSRDKESEDNFSQVMGLMRQVKEEYGERGLGLTHVYKVGMRACMDFGQQEEALQLFQELKSFPESPPNRQCYDLAIVANCLLGGRDEAIEIIEEMKEAGHEPTERSYMHVLRACRDTEGGSTVARTVMELYASEEGIDTDGLLPRNLALCHSHLMVLVAADEWEGVVELFWKLVDRGQPAPDSACYDAVMLTCRRNRRWKEALKVLNHVRREDVRAEPTEGNFIQAIMTMLADVEERTDAAVKAALSLLEEMRNLGMFDALRPLSMSNLLHAVFNACVRWEQHWPTAIEVFGMMEEHDDIVPAAGEYRSMLHMLSLTKTVPRGGNWSRSLELLREARGMDHRLTEISYNTVITDLGFAGKVDLAFKVFDDMRTTGLPLTVNTYNRLLGVCEKNAEVDRTFKVLDEMYKCNLPPNVVSFGSAISACGKGRQWRKALALLVRMQHDQIEPNLQCMNAAINALGLSEEWQRAESILEVIRKSGMMPNVVSYNSMAMAYATAGQSDRVFQLLDTMRENGVEPDAITYGTVLKACEGENALSSIRYLLDEMDSLGIQKTVVHFSAAIDASNRMRETSSSWELWRMMGVNNIEPNNHAYSAIINTAAIDRDVRTALRLLEEMQKKGIAIDVVTYTTAICACGPDWLLALDVLEDMALDGVPPNLLSYTAAMGACVAGGEYREAIGVFNRMREAGIVPDLRAYNLAIMANDKDGDEDGKDAMQAELQLANLRRQDWETEW